MRLSSTTFVLAGALFKRAAWGFARTGTFQAQRNARGFVQTNSLQPHHAPRRHTCQGQGPLMAIKGPVRYKDSDWVECLLTLPTSRILNRIRNHLLFTIAWTSAVAWMHMSGTLKFPAMTVPHSVMGSALSLLLVFRTNASYDRFWEGRKLWSQIIAATREIARLSALHLKKEYHTRIGRLLVVFPIVLKQHLQGERVAEELTALLSPEETAALLGHRNRPSAVMQELASYIHKAFNKEVAGADSADRIIATAHEGHISENIHSLVGACTGCERLIKQPVPLSYSRHSSRMLSLYVFTLPFTLVATMGWLVVPVVSAIAWGFFSTHEIGHFIEEPFNRQLQLIPLGQLITVIRLDVADMFAAAKSSGQGFVRQPSVEAGSHVVDGEEPIFPKAITELDQKLLKDAQKNSRAREDAFFAYY